MVFLRRQERSILANEKKANFIIPLIHVRPCVCLSQQYVMGCQNTAYV